MNRIYNTLLLVGFFLFVSTSVLGYNQVPEDYAVNIVTAYGEEASEVTCRPTENDVAMCSVRTKSGKLYLVLCQRRHTPGNDDYFCTVAH